MKPAVAVIILCQCARHFVLADFMYQIQIHITSAPKAVVNEIKADIQANASEIVAPFFEVKPVFVEVAPGEVVTEPNPTDSNTGVRGLLRGMMRRHMQAGSQCPQKCKADDPNVKWCLMVGCARCSDSGCSRRLQEGGSASESLTVTRTEEKYILSTMNLELESYCGDDPDCSISTALVQVNDDGTVTSDFN